MDKSPDAFRTISEVADELDLPQHVLRFWETKFSQIKPMKRGGGRRYYRRNEVDLLRGIRHLLYTEGYTIKGVQKIFREQGTGYVLGLLDSDFEDSGGATEPASAKEKPKAQRVEPPIGSAAAASTQDPGLSKKAIRNLKSILNDLKQARKMLFDVQ